MKAIRLREFGPPQVMRLEDVPDLRPGPRQVLVRVKAVGVNPVETYQRAGGYARKPALPYTPGSDAAGIIESVGGEVNRFRGGERVYTSGTLTGAYAEQALCDEHQVHLLPEGVSFSQGAAVSIPYATAYFALFRRAESRPGEILLVHGATGGVGIAAIQMARAAGMTVIGTGGSEEGRALLLAQGCRLALDHRLPGYLDDLQALTGGHGFDVILEMLANVNLERDLKALALAGRLVLIGSRGRIEIDPREVMSRQAVILGMLLFNVPQPEMDSIHAALGAGLSNGTLRPVVGQELPLVEAPRAHERILQSGAHGKIVLIP